MGVVGQVDECSVGRSGVEIGGEVEESDVVARRANRPRDGGRQVVDGPGATGRVVLEPAEVAIDPELRRHEGHDEVDALRATERAGVGQDRLKSLESGRVASARHAIGVAFVVESNPFAPASASSGKFARKCSVSRVQPGVNAFGKK